jgi:hypothetical protein
VALAVPVVSLVRMMTVDDILARAIVRDRNP